MSKSDDDPVTFAKVIDIDQARGRRDETARLMEPPKAPPTTLRGGDYSRVEANRLRQIERTARKRRRLQERTAGLRAAASSHRIQVRVADRLARIEAELEAEIARLRLAYAQGRNHASTSLWMWPAMATFLLVLVAGFAYFAGTQQTTLASAAVASPWVASKPLDRQPRAHRGPIPPRTTSGRALESASPASDPTGGKSPSRPMSPASYAPGGNR